MKNFECIAKGLDVIPLRHAITRHPELWNKNRFRTTYQNTPHKDVDDIWLRYSEMKDTSDISETINVLSATKAVWYEGAKTLSQFKPIVLDLMRRVEAYELERLLITRIVPGGVILPHADDQGPYVHLGDIARYHVVIQGLPGSLFRCGDETVCMETGDVWWFNAHEVHEVLNNSTDDRIHMLVDVRTMQ